MRLTRGTTLIEVLAAFAVISTGLMAVMGLAFANRRLSQGNVDQMMATSMAREGLELIMQMRDSNWLSGANFDGGSLAGPAGDGTATLVWSGNPSQAAPVLDFIPNNFAHDSTNVVSVGSPPFLANKNAPAAISGVATPYRRLITLTALCDSGTPPYTESADQTCLALAMRVGIRVRSEVQWSRNGTNSSVVMYNDLYDWR